MKILAVPFLILTAVVAPAQTGGGGVLRTVRASGTADVVVRPDQARIYVAVVTQATTAEEASQINATRTQAVIDAVRALIGNAGEIRTQSYSVSPVREGNPSRVTGYSVTNSLALIVNNLNITGRVLDAAVAAGANRIDGLSLGLREDEPLRVQALRAAGQVAKTRAEAIAGGLGLRLGQVVNASEAGVSSIGSLVRAPSAGLAVTTPIEAGTLTVSATIAVEYEVVP